MTIPPSTASASLVLASLHAAEIQDGRELIASIISSLTEDCDSAFSRSHLPYWSARASVTSLLSVRDGMSAMPGPPTYEMATIKTLKMESFADSTEGRTDSTPDQIEDVGERGASCHASRRLGSSGSRPASQQELKDSLLQLREIQAKPISCLRFADNADKEPPSPTPSDESKTPNRKHSFWKKFMLKINPDLREELAGGN